MSTYMMPLFAVIAIFCAAGIVFIVGTVHRYPGWRPGDDTPDVPEHAAIRRQMR